MSENDRGARRERDGSDSGIDAALEVASATRCREIGRVDGSGMEPRRPAWISTFSYRKSERIMAGCLMYAARFECVHYTGNEGLPHYEVQTPTGYDYAAAYSTWPNTVDYFSAHGVPDDRWPVYEQPFDISLAGW
jgi:hypothetical protein